MRTKLQGRKCTLGCVCSCSGSEEGGSCDNKYIYFEEGGGTWKSIISKDNNDSYSECVGCGLNMLPLFRTVHLGLQNVQYPKCEVHTSTDTKLSALDTFCVCFKQVFKVFH